MTKTILARVEAWLQKYGVWLVLGLSLAISVGTIVYFYLHGEILGYNDARSRLDIARSVFDSQTPGIVQIGSIWPPLYQFLIAPWTANDFLWHTGLAGSIVSGIAYIVAAIYLYKGVSLVTRQAWLGIAGALLFMLNPNILYLQSTAMTEVLLCATLAGTMYHLLRWVQAKNLFDLILAGFWVALATLTRYEGWLVVGACLVIIIVESLLIDRSARKAEGRAVLFAMLALFGVLLWLFWNLLFWGNPLYFLNGNSMAGNAGSGHENLVYYIVMTLKAMRQNVGLILLLSAPVGLLAAWFRQTERRIGFYALALAATPLLTTVATTYLGMISIRADDIVHGFDVRYGITAVLLIAVTIPLIIAQLPKLVKPLAVSAALFLCIFATPASAYYAGVHGSEAMSSSDYQFTLHLKTLYRGGKILASNALTLNPIKQAAGLPLKNYTDEANNIIWQQALINPQRMDVRLIVMGDSEEDPVYTAYRQHEMAYTVHYKVLYAQGLYTIYELRR